MSPFPAGALEANRAGRLTETQRKNWTGADRDWRGNVRLMALVLGLAGVLLVAGIRQTPFPTFTQLLLGTVCLILAAYLVYVSTLGGGALTRDLREGRVEAVEGAISREGRGLPVNAGPNPERCYLHIAGKRLACGRTAYDAAPQAGIVRAYYLPRSRRLINLERLANRPLRAGALDHPLAAVGQAFSAMDSEDRTQQAEAMATVEAIKDAIFGEASSPPIGTAGARPLAEAIVGSWRSPVMNVTFSENGTAAAKMANGMALAGRWSIAGDGKLRLAGMGQDMETDASVAGDVLSVVMEGNRLNFRRAGSA
jgi:hypothetical protein